jgi:hypothetical protein
MGRFLQSFVPGASLSREQLVSSLFWISSLTLILGATAVFYVPATGPVFGPYPATYYITLVAILAAAAVELATAYWLSCSNGRGALALAKFVMNCAHPVFVVVLSISGFGILFAREGLPRPLS